MIAIPQFSYLYSRNGHFYLRLSVKSKQIWLSLKTTSLEDALQLRAKVKPLLKKSTAVSRLGDEYVNFYLDELKSNIYSTITENDLATLKKPIKDEPLIQEPEDKLTPTFYDVAEEYIAKSKAEVKGLKAYRRYLEIWVHLAENKAINKFTPKEIGQIIDKYFKLPVSNKLPYSRMTWEERANCNIEHESDYVSRKSAGEFYKWVRAVFSFACNEELGYIKVNPCSIKRNYKTATMGYFKDKELNIMQDNLHNEKKDWQRWILLIAMYHGMRRGEICQLRREDILVDDKTSRPYFFIRALVEGQSVKNNNSIRKVPVHNALLEMKFMDWVNTKKNWLFGDVKDYSVTGWFSRYLNRLDIATTDEYGNKKTLHSLRHTFITKVRNSYSNLYHIQQVVGHRLQKGDITDNYTHGTNDLSCLIPVVDSFSLDKL